MSIDIDYRGYARLQATQQRSVPFYPHYARLVGSATAAILLAQANYWWHKNDEQPFYKFFAPCSLDQYTPGDSWTEELAFGTTELSSALARIGTKITTGVSKKSVLDDREPIFAPLGDIRRGVPALANAAHLLAYWTDSSRVTWFHLNTQLLGKTLFSIFQGKSELQDYLVHGRKPITSHTEMNAEMNAEKILAPAYAGAPVETFEYRQGEPIPDDGGAQLALLQGFAAKATGSVPAVRERTSAAPSKEPSAHKALVDAYVGAIGYTPAIMSRVGNVAKRMVKANVDPADIAPLVAYIRATDSRYKPGKDLPLEIVEQTRPAWIAAGRPSGKPGDVRQGMPQTPPTPRTTPTRDFDDGLFGEFEDGL